MSRKLEIRTCRSGAAILLCLGVIAAGCTAKRDTVNEVKKEEAAPAGPVLASSVRTGDASVAGQLVSGFYAIENGWRWTAGKFSVQLKTPAGAAQHGGDLSFSFTIPEVVIQKLKEITLSASINGMLLKSSSYKEPGAFTFVADVPASMLSADSVYVDFALDKSLPPSVDKRQLGVIAVSASLASK